MKAPRPASSPTARSASARPEGEVTLAMVAQEAGVSASTVSRILNGTAVVSAARRKAVEDAIARLGFIPNPVARGLAGGRTLSVGVVTQALDSPFYGPALRGIEDELTRAGYSPLFVSGHWDETTEARCIETLRSRRVDGIIILTGRLSDQALRACARSLPVVVTGRTLRAPGLFSLNFDDLTGGRLATEHLLSLGHRRIAFIAGAPGHADALARHRGYEDALRAAGLVPDPRLFVQGDFSETSGLNAVESLLAERRRFSAVFAANDQMAFGAALALHRHGIAVPDEISVTGFDDVPASEFMIPPLSTVHQPVHELGVLAASAMLQLLAGQKPSASMPAPRFIARESSRALRR